MTRCWNTSACLTVSLVLALLSLPQAAAAQPARENSREDPCDAAGGGGSVWRFCDPGETAPCVGGFCEWRFCSNGRWSDCVYDGNVACQPPGPSCCWISEGPEVTPTDIAQFDARWTNQGMREHASKVTREQICGRCDECVWGLAERMHALVRMRDLTQAGVHREHAGIYLGQLHDLVEIALAFRDDRHRGGVCETNGPFFPPQPLDEVRGRNMRAWGGQSPSGGDMHSVNPAISSQYAYAMAAFARIVFEDPQAQDRYGADAVKHANAVIETVWELMPEVTTRNRGGSAEAYLVGGLPGYKVVTKTQCDTAHTNELARIKRECEERDCEEQERNDAIKRADGMWSDCKIAAELGPAAHNMPLAHNITLMFGMVLIELARALDSPFYRNSRDASSDAPRTREMIPLQVSRLQRFFAKRLYKKARGTRYCWNFSDDLSGDINYHAEDTSHGAWEIRFIELLTRDFDRLNAQAAPRGEPIALDAGDMPRFANTFLQKVFRGKHLAYDVTGRLMPSGEYDSACHGWVILAAADPRVYTACRNVALRFFNGQQPNLGIGNHAALLANKRFAPPALPSPPPVTVPDVTELNKKNASDFVRAAGLVPKYRERTSGNWVARQEPAAGTLVPRGSTVVLSLRPNAPN